METLKSLELSKYKDIVLNHPLIDTPLTFVKEFVDDPKTKFNSLSKNEKIAFVTCSSLVTVSSFAYVKFKFEYYRLLNKGYRPADTISNVWQTLGLRDINPTVNGLQVCKDTFTFDDFVEFWTNMAIEYINFRSIIQFKLGSWYWIELSLSEYANDKNFHPPPPNGKDDTRINSEFTRRQFYDLYGFDIFNRIQYVSVDKLPDEYEKRKQEYIEKNKNSTCILYDVEQVLLEYVTNYFNTGKNGSTLNPNWDKKYAEIPNWNTFYFHFKQENRCVAYFQANHSVCDGILASTITLNMYTKMYSNIKNRLRKRRLSKEQYAIQQDRLRKDMIKRKMREITMWTYIYWLSTIPSAVFQFLRAMTVDGTDPHSALLSTMSHNYNISLSKPINLKAFYSVTKSQLPLKNNTKVNDLFMAISCKSLARYLNKKKDPKFTLSPTGKPEFTFLRGVLPINARRVDSNGLKQSIKYYSLTGQNSNELYLCPARVPLVNVSAHSIAKMMKPFKFGIHPAFFSKLVDIFNIFPYGITFFIDVIGKSVSVVFSNFIGPQIPMPIPGERKQINNNKDNISGINDNYSFGIQNPTDLDDVNENNDDSIQESTEEEIKTGKFEMDSYINSKDLIMNKEEIKWVFGAATPSVAALNITCCTYNGYCRIGVLTDTSCIRDPQELLDCWMEEWNEFETEVYPNGWKEEK